MLKRQSCSIENLALTILTVPLWTFRHVKVNNGRDVDSICFELRLCIPFCRGFRLYTYLNTLIHSFIQGKDKVCIRAKWPIRMELVPVSVGTF